MRNDLMKKMRLDMDALAVESFTTIGGYANRGTVNGNEASIVNSVCYAECANSTACTAEWYNTCQGSCVGKETCANTCPVSCNCSGVCDGGNISAAQSCQSACGCTDTGGETGYTDYGCQNTA